MFEAKVAKLGEDRHVASYRIRFDGAADTGEAEQGEFSTSAESWTWIYARQRELGFPGVNVMLEDFDSSLARDVEIALLLQLTPDETATLDEWIGKQSEPKPSRSAAIRKIVTEALKN